MIQYLTALSYQEQEQQMPCKPQPLHTDSHSDQYMHTHIKLFLMLQLHFQFHLCLQTVLSTCVYSLLLLPVTRVQMPLTTVQSTRSKAAKLQPELSRKLTQTVTKYATCTWVLRNLCLQLVVTQSNLCVYSIWIFDGHHLTKAKTMCCIDSTP